MRIILSPAKKMNTADSIGIDYTDLPVFLQDAEQIRQWLQTKTFAELKKLWACNDKIAEQNIERLNGMDLRSRLAPAILSYDGIAYQYMAPAVFETEMLAYIQEHLRILSGFYGVLRPLDGVTPYRLEMQAKTGNIQGKKNNITEADARIAEINGKNTTTEIGKVKNLYEFWADRLYREVRDDSGIIINLASKEYSRCIEKYLKPEDLFITCTFAEEEKGKLVQKGVYCKMARGEMVRYMAEHKIENPEDMKAFHVLGYQYHDELSSGTEYVFLREKAENSIEEG